MEIRGGDTGWRYGVEEKKDELQVEIVDTGQIRSYRGRVGLNK